MQLFL